MRQILSRSVLTVAAASSILAVAGGYAEADSDAQGAAVGSPGVLSGNSVSAPIDVPVNACGNTVNAVGVGNATFGNTCANVSTRHSGEPSRDGRPHHPGSPGAGAGRGPGDASKSAPAAEPRNGGASGRHVVADSPGVLSGNAVDAPVDVPVNACGNSVNAGGLLNPAMGNSCANVEEGPTQSTPTRPRQPHQPPATPPRSGTRGSTGPAKPPSAPKHQAGNPKLTPVADTGGNPPRAHLAATGVDENELGVAGATAIGLLVGGAILYRRGRRASTRRR